jgi:hypothetical protein
VELDSANDRAVIIDTASTTRTIKTSELEQPANYKAPRRLGIKSFGESRAGCEQGKDYNRTPRNHIDLPSTRHQ